jgi:hypothetical protein
VGINPKDVLPGDILSRVYYDWTQNFLVLSKSEFSKNGYKPFVSLTLLEIDSNEKSTWTFHLPQTVNFNLIKGSDW